MTARTAAILDHYARPVAPVSPSWAELSRRLGRARNPLATVDHYVRAA